jgi:uncharacterized membrane protein
MVVADASLLGTLAAIALLVVVWNAVASFVNYRERAEKPTQDNTIKRISEQQGQERFNDWMAVRAIWMAVGRALLVVAIVYVGWRLFKA